MRQLHAAAAALLLIIASAAPAFAQAPVAYRLSSDTLQLEHHLLHVDVTFNDVPAAPLELHMSRASPGRYAVHEFSKNLFDLRVDDGTGRALTFTHPNPQQWIVAQHPATVHVSYVLFGDRTDGTYLSADTAHVHFNSPSVFMWARGFDDRPVTVRFEQPMGVTGWRVATQLFPTPDTQTFTAPNLQYLMDSPVDWSGFSLRTFTIQDGARQPTFRLAVHHEGDDAELDSYARDVEKIVREERAVYGEFAPYDAGTYTFIADYTPWASGDGMEHRNSTLVSAAASIRANRPSLLSTIAHEFFHSWNVERIRPKSLEPFNFDDANMSGELWLAEGFTNYYGPLMLQRAGLTQLAEYMDTISYAINTVTLSPGRQVHTAVEISQMAPFVDAAVAIDRTDFDNTFISYYTWGESIALGLDLTLRERSGGRITLDDFMRAMWTQFGKPGGRPGYVDRPYTIDDARTVLGTVAGDQVFADEFFRQYIEGHDVVNYQHLLANAGLVLRPRAPQASFIGEARMQDAPGGGARIVSATLRNTPLYIAGLDRDDVITSIGSTAVTRADQVDPIVRSTRPGASLTVTYLHHGRGPATTAAVQTVADPRLEVVAAEQAAQQLTPAQRQFRDAWLRTKTGNGF